MSDECRESVVTSQTLAAWRATLATIRNEERQRSHELPAETGRLLEVVGQALAQGGGVLPSEDITRIEEVTGVGVMYRTIKATAV